LVWLGDVGDAYRALIADLNLAAGLEGDSATALWFFLDWKRREVWYVKGQPRTPASIRDEEETAELKSFTYNNLTVELGGGMTLAHFMAIHYGVNYFTYRVWRKYSEWKQASVVKASVTALIPKMEVEEVPDGRDRILWQLKLEFVSRFPGLIHPELVVEKATSRHNLNIAKLKLGVKEDEVATVEIMAEVQKLARKLGN
jgi:hypothetical protein